MLKEFLEDILDYLEDNFKYDLAMLVVFVFCICMAYAAMNGIYMYADKNVITDIPQSRDGRWQKS